jgi:hypothetical protein
MLTHKEFYFWLEGYLHGRLEDKHIQITPIVEKMNEVKEVNPLFPNSRTTTPITIPTPKNPFKDDGYDDLGTPPKIVM